MICTNTCFNVGINGGCGLNCNVFLEGECDEPECFSIYEIEKEHGYTVTKQLDTVYNHPEWRVL